jgi:hypothetical protein
VSTEPREDSCSRRPRPRKVDVRRQTFAREVSRVYRRTMLRSAALASSVVASMPDRLPQHHPASASRCNTHVKTARCVPRSISRRVRSRSSSGQPSVRAASTKKVRTLSEAAGATSSRARSRILRSSRATTSENTDPGRDWAVPSPRRRRLRTRPRQSRQLQLHPQRPAARRIAVAVELKGCYVVFGTSSSGNSQTLVGLHIPDLINAAAGHID